MTNTAILPPKPLDDRGLVLVDLVEDNERLERENVELRRDCESLRVTLQASCDLNRKYYVENLKLRSYTKQVRATAADRRAA